MNAMLPRLGSLSVSFRSALRYGSAVLWLVLGMFLRHSIVAAGAPAMRHSAIPPDQIGATAQKQYKGDGLSVWATDRGARLRCSFQSMEGEIMSKGLWLSFTAEGS